MLVIYATTTVALPGRSWDELHIGEAFVLLGRDGRPVDAGVLRVKINNLDYISSDSRMIFPFEPTYRRGLTCGDYVGVARIASILQTVEPLPVGGR